jgi:hypothetical protein
MAPRTPSARQIKQGTAAARAAAKAAAQSKTGRKVGKIAGDFWKGQQAAAGDYRFAKPSLWFGGQGSLQQPAPGGVNKAAYRAGNVAQDIMGQGFNARTLFNLHPADFTSGMVQNQINQRTNAPNAFAQMTGFAAVGAMGLGSGNTGTDARQGLRPAGYQSLSAPDPERLEDGTVTIDYTRSVNPTWDSFNRVTLGRSGKLLPFEQYITERDDKAKQHGLNPQELKGLNILYKGGSDKLSGILDEKQFLSENRDYVRNVGKEQAAATYQNLLGAYGEYADYNEYMGKPMSAFDYAKLKNAGKKPDTLAYEQYRQDTYGNGIAGGLIRGTTDGIEGSGIEARIMGYRVTPTGALAALGTTAAAIAYAQNKWGKGDGKGRAEYNNVEPPRPLAPDTPGGAAPQAPSNYRGSGRSPSPNIAAAESVYARAVAAANRVPAERLTTEKIQRGLAKNSATAGLDGLAREQMAQQIYQQSMRSRQAAAPQPQQQQQAAAPRNLAEQQARQRQQQAAQAQPDTIAQPYQQQQAGRSRKPAPGQLGLFEQAAPMSAAERAASRARKANELMGGYSRFVQDFEYYPGAGSDAIDALNNVDFPEEGPYNQGPLNVMPDRAKRAYKQQLARSYFNDEIGKGDLEFAERRLNAPVKPPATPQAPADWYQRRDSRQQKATQTMQGWDYFYEDFYDRIPEKGQDFQDHLVDRKYEYPAYSEAPDGPRPPLHQLPEPTQRGYLKQVQRWAPEEAARVQAEMRGIAPQAYQQQAQQAMQQRIMGGDQAQPYQQQQAGRSRKPSPGQLGLFDQPLPPDVPQTNPRAAAAAAKVAARVAKLGPEKAAASRELKLNRTMQGFSQFYNDYGQQLPDRATAALDHALYKGLMHPGYEGLPEVADPSKLTGRAKAAYLKQARWVAPEQADQIAAQLFPKGKIPQSAAVHPGSVGDGLARSLHPDEWEWRDRTRAAQTPAERAAVRAQIAQEYRAGWDPNSGTIAQQAQQQQSGPFSGSSPNRQPLTPVQAQAEAMARPSSAMQDLINNPTTTPAQRLQQQQQAQQQAMQQRIMGGDQPQPYQQQQAGPGDKSLWPESVRDVGPKKKQTRVSAPRKAAMQAAEALGWDLNVEHGYLTQEVTMYNNQGQPLGTTSSITEAAEKMGRDAAILEQLKQQASLSMQAGDTAQFNRIAAEMDKLQRGTGGALLEMTPQQRAVQFENQRQELRAKYSGNQPTTRIERMQQQGKIAAIAQANNQGTAPEMAEFIRSKGIKNPWADYGVADAYEVDNLGERMRTIESRRAGQSGAARFVQALNNPRPTPPKAPDWTRALPDNTSSMSMGQLSDAVQRGMDGYPIRPPSAPQGIDPAGAPNRRAQFPGENLGTPPTREALGLGRPQQQPKAPDWTKALPGYGSDMPMSQLSDAVQRGMDGYNITPPAPILGLKAPAPPLTGWRADVARQSIPGKIAFLPARGFAENAPALGQSGTVTPMTPDPWKGKAAPVTSVSASQLFPGMTAEQIRADYRRQTLTPPRPQLTGAAAAPALPAARPGGALATTARPGALSTPGFFGGDISGAITNQRGPAQNIAAQLPPKTARALPQLPPAKAAVALPAARTAQIAPNRALVEAPGRALTTAQRLNGGMIQTGTPAARASGAAPAAKAAAKAAAATKPTKLGKGLGLVGVGFSALSAASEFNRAQKEGASIPTAAARGAVTLGTDLVSWAAEPLAKGLTGATYAYNPANWVNAVRADLGNKDAAQALNLARTQQKGQQMKVDQAIRDLPKNTVGLATRAARAVGGLFGSKQGQQTAAQIAQEKRTSAPAPAKATPPPFTAATYGPQIMGAAAAKAAPQTDYQKLFNPDGGLSTYGENMQTSLGEYGFNKLMEQQYKAQATGTTTAGKPAAARDYMGEAKTKADATRYTSDNQSKVGLDKNARVENVGLDSNAKKLQGQMYTSDNDYRGKVDVAKINAGVGYDKNARVENVGLDSNAKRLQGQMYVSDNDLRGKLGVASINAGTVYDKNAREENVGLDRNAKDLQGKLGVASINAGTVYDKNAREENVGLDRNAKELQGKLGVADISGGWDYRTQTDKQRIANQGAIAQAAQEGQSKIAQIKAEGKAAAADRTNAWGYERIRQVQGVKADQMAAQNSRAAQRKSDDEATYQSDLAVNAQKRSLRSASMDRAAASADAEAERAARVRIARIQTAAASRQRSDPSALISNALSTQSRRW